jgi:hypothetical protein
MKTDECYAPPESMSDLEVAYNAGRVTNLNVLLETTLWVCDFDWHTPPSGEVTWCRKWSHLIICASPFVLRNNLKILSFRSN